MQAIRFLLNKFGKPITVSTQAATDTSVLDCHNINNHHTSHRLVITDRVSGRQFLIDTGSDVSIIPCNSRQGSATDLKLFAANNTIINTYGKTLLSVDLKLRRTFKWQFIKAPIAKAIIGADFLHDFNLIVNIRNRRLLDKVTNLSSLCIESHSSICSIKAYNSE